MNRTLNGNCDSCLMPFSKDPKGQNRDHDKFCTYCYSNGKLNYLGSDLKEFKKAMISAIISRGEPRLKAQLFAFMAGFAPRWKSGYKLT